VIRDAKVAKDRTELLGELVQLSVNAFGLPAVGNPLRLPPVIDLGKSVVPQPLSDVALLPLTSQPVVPVAVDLQPAR
jgi:hypothetical protein